MPELLLKSFFFKNLPGRGSPIKESMAGPLGPCRMSPSTVPNSAAPFVFVPQLHVWLGGKRRSAEPSGRQLRWDSCRSRGSKGRLGGGLTELTLKKKIKDAAINRSARTGSRIDAETLHVIRASLALPQSFPSGFCISSATVRACPCYRCLRGFTQAGFKQAGLAVWPGQFLTQYRLPNMPGVRGR